ncbi:hypothetical protein EDB19DRAFT_1827952 [Suillus lakei]|nr:hypothetical protein EDB19DRAFT_1827952 [Suillus lakei]
MWKIKSNPMTCTKQTYKKSTGGSAKCITIDYVPLLNFNSSTGMDLNSDLAMDKTVLAGRWEETRWMRQMGWMGCGVLSAGMVQVTMSFCTCVTFVPTQCALAASTFPLLTPMLNNLLVLPTFLPIHGALEVSLQSQISSTPVVLIHLMLVDFKTSGRPFDLMFWFLSSYFHAESKSNQYQVKVGELVHSLMAQRHWPHIVFTISNHTDDDLGDPFLGYETKKKLYVSGQVDSFFDIILTPWQPLIKSAKDSYLWFLSCGALINNEESFSSLKTAILHHHITATICFNAICFQPSFAAPLLLGFAELILTECLPIHKVFPDMLMQSYKLGRHTDVFLLMTNAGHALDITRFAWMHCKEHPWGHHLSLQCPQCGWANSWHSANHKKTYSFECMNSKCRKGYFFSPSENSVILSHARKSGSCWIAVGVEANLLVLG